MSDMFRDREKGEEARYKLDEEQRFKAHARRNKLLGLWAAEKMGLGGDDAESYAKSVVQLDFDAKGDDNVVEKLMADFAGKSVDASEEEVRAKIEELQALAEKQIAGDYPDPLDSDHEQVGG